MKLDKKLLLIGESFSPWTKKARWALEQCELPYTYEEYTPILSEPLLRWRMRQWNGSVSVPVLFVDHHPIRGSWEIACYANKMSGDDRLGDFRMVTQWDDLSEAALAQGRTNVVRRILRSNQALEESLPAFLPKSLRKPFRFISRGVVQNLDRKYAHLVQPGALRRALLSTREALDKTGSGFLLERFSYADITMAVVLEVIAPIAQTSFPLGPATKDCWNDLLLADEFEDLLSWRDQLAQNVTTTFSQFKQYQSQG